jgi:tRNA(fMet)-specific endonuclease VapC
MSLWILDTDHVSLLLNEHPQISRKVMAIGADVTITIVTVQEIFNGWIVRINAESELEEIIRLYGNLNRTVALFKRLPVLNFDAAAGNCYEQMLQSTPALSKKRLQKDMRIAAIALSREATVVTRNYRDFAQVPNLLLEDWTQEN